MHFGCVSFLARWNLHGCKPQPYSGKPVEVVTCRLIEILKIVYKIFSKLTLLPDSSLLSNFIKKHCEMENKSQHCEDFCVSIVSKTNGLGKLRVHSARKLRIEHPFDGFAPVKCHEKYVRTRSHHVKYAKAKHVPTLSTNRQAAGFDQVLGYDPCLPV